MEPGKTTNEKKRTLDEDDAKVEEEVTSKKLKSDE